LIVEPQGLPLRRVDPQLETGLYVTIGECIGDSSRQDGRAGLDIDADDVTVVRGSDSELLQQLVRDPIVDRTRRVAIFGKLRLRGRVRASRRRSTTFSATV